MILQLNTARERARHLATHDQLTGLANRSLFQDRLSQAMSAARRGRHKLAVMFLDLDGFKGINDSLGHAVGDGLLRAIARRLGTCLRETDTAARFGGDEFAVLLTNLSNELDAATVAKKLLESLGEPIEFRRQATTIHTSIGIATFPRDAVGPEELIKKSDTAMYHAKERGGSRFEFYTEDMNEAIQRRAAIEERLRSALDEDRLVLHYQPQFDLTRGRIIGAEALIRWRHSELGLRLPRHTSCPIAEETGLIVPIGNWILQGPPAGRTPSGIAPATADSASLSMSHHSNSSRPGFADVRAPRRSMRAGLAGRYPSSWRSPRAALLQATSTSRSTPCGSLKDLGVRLAIDDFGTGYSALAYLKTPAHRRAEDRPVLRPLPHHRPRRRDHHRDDRAAWPRA